MATLADLLIKMDMDSAKVRDQIDKMSNAFDGFGKKLTRVGNMVGAALAADAVKDAVSSLVRFVAQGAEAADKMGKLAQSVGTPVESLSALSHAAKLSDVSAEDLGKSLGKLSKNMAEAADGTGSQAAAFQTLGLKVTDSNGKLKNADVMLKELAGKFAGMEDGAAKTALAMEFFGKSGADLIPLLNAGADGIASMEEEARKLGLVITENTAKSAEEFNDNVTRLKAAGEGLALSVSSQLTPTLSNLTKELLTSTDGTSALSDAATVLATTIKLLVSGGVILAGVFNVVGKSLGAVAAAVVSAAQGNFKEAYGILQAGGEDVVNSVSGTYKRLEAVWSNSADGIEKSAPNIAKKTAAPLVKSAEELAKAKTKALDTLNDAIMDVQKRIDAFSTPKSESAKLSWDLTFGKFAEAAKKGGREGQAASVKLRDLVEVLSALERGEKAAKGMTKLSDELEAANNQLDVQRSKITESGTAYEEMANRLATGDLAKSIQEALASGADPKQLSDYRDRLLETAKAQDELTLAAENNKEWMDEFNRTVEDAARVYEETATPAEKYADTMKRLNELFAEGAIDSKTFGRATKKAVDEFAANDEATKRLRDWAEGASSSIVSVFEDQMVTGFKGGLDDMVSAFGASVKQMIMQALAADLQKKLMGGLMSLGGAFGLGGILSGGGTTGRASGGVIEAGKLYRVGEHGPETFLSGRPGFVFPTDFGDTVSRMAAQNAFGELDFGGNRAGGGDVHPNAFYRVGEHGPETFVPNVAGYILPPDGGKQRRNQSRRGESRDVNHKFDQRFMRLTFKEAMEQMLLEERT